MSLSLIIDVGTTNIKAGVVDKEGQVLSQGSKRLELMRPEKGAVEHDPEQIFTALVPLCRQVVKKYAQDINILALSGYMYGFLPLDKDGRPLTGIITLLDTRTKPVMEKIEKEYPVVDIYEKSGSQPMFISMFSRLLWLQEAKPQIFAKSRYFVGIKGYLFHRLCGRYMTDPGIASATQLYNIHDMDWDEDILQMVGINSNQLPEVVAGDRIVGDLSRKTAELLGLKGEVKVLPGYYDGGSMIIGMGGFDTSQGICNIGTTAMLRSSSNKPLFDDLQKRRLTTISLSPGRWAIGGAINNAGIILQWFKDNLAGGMDYNMINEEAAGIVPGSDGLFCLPFLTGERDPRVGDLASASFFGLREYHTAGHVGRAVLEGVGYSLNMIKKAQEENGLKLEGIMLGGSGSKSNIWPQILADIFNLPVTRALTRDSTLIGAALLAFTALGEYSTLTEGGKVMVKKGQVFEPRSDNVRFYRQGYEFFAELVSRNKELYSLHSRLF